ncbi:MAG: hypothetical protein ACRDOH_09725 [Streptosporangiaceae bacterium]
MGSLDRPDQPDEPGRAERARDASAGRPRTREMPDPDERGRVYEAVRAHVSAETGERADRNSAPEQRCEGTGTPNYRNEVPRFLDMWADHQKRWPTRPRVAVDHSADPPERHVATAEAIGRIREAESGLSADAQTIEQENKDKHGGWLEGFEHRLKREDRLKEKIAEKLGAEPRTTASEALREVADTIRYTYCFQPENYTRGYYDITERYERRGYEMYYSKNWWTNPEYKGINTRWITSNGQRFEVQFHTLDSFHAKHHVTHAAYERIRDSATSDEERAELKAFQREVSSRIQVPDGAADIPDYKKEGF